MSEERFVSGSGSVEEMAGGMSRPSNKLKRGGSREAAKDAKEEPAANGPNVRTGHGGFFRRATRAGKSPVRARKRGGTDDEKEPPGAWAPSRANLAGEILFVSNNRAGNGSGSCNAAYLKWAEVARFIEQLAAHSAAYWGVICPWKGATMKNRVILVAAIVIATLVGAGWWLTREPDQAGGLTPIRVAQTGDFLLYAGLYVAKDAGIFERNGLDVQITSTGGDEQSAAAVISGHAEFGIGDPAFAAIANVRGQDLRFFASLVNGAPFWGITYNRDVVRRYNASGLRGLRVATFPAPSTAYALQREMYQSAGIPPAIQEGAFGSLDGMLQSGRADIALELEPNVSLAQQRGATVLYSMAQRVGAFTVTGVIVSARYAQAHPADTAAFCRSLDQAFALIRAEPDRAQALLATRFRDVPPAVIHSALRRVVSEGVIPATATVNPQGWERALQLRASVGDLTNVQVGRTALDRTLCQPAAVTGN